MFSKLLWFAMVRLAVTKVRVDAYVLEERDFNADLRNLNQIIQLLHSMHSRAAIPFSATTNTVLPLSLIMEVDTLDLGLLPCRYCISCDPIAHPTLEDSTLPSPLINRMVEVDEKQIIIVCAKLDWKHGLEFPSSKACRTQHKVLKKFMIGLRTLGSRLVIHEMLLEMAPHLEWNYATGEDGCRCIEKDESGSGCSVVSTETKIIGFSGVTGLTTISVDEKFADIKKETYLGVGIGPTSLLVAATSTNFPMSSPPYISSTPVPSDDIYGLPSGYYESFWSSMLSDYPDYPFFTTSSQAMPSTMVSIARTNASTTSETIVATGISTDTPS